MNLVIRHLDDLETLIDAREKVFKVSIHHLDDEQNSEIQLRLAPDYRYCGCTEATIGLVVGVALSGITVWFFGVGWLALPIVIVAAIMCSGLAKINAQQVAHRRLIRTIASIKHLHHHLS
ncbi:MAG: hypothetical protein ACT4O9_04185 [Blastocatellia bacterium]